MHPTVVELVSALALLVGLVAGGGAWAAFRARARLPLEIAPAVLRGEADAIPIVRFRFRLGLGRVLTDARAEVWFVSASGERTELEAFVPPGRLVGPVTVVARDPDRLCGHPVGHEQHGTFEVTVTVRSAGRAWAATRTVAASGAAGRFGLGWTDRIESADPDPAC